MLKTNEDKIEIKIKNKIYKQLIIHILLYTHNLKKNKTNSIARYRNRTCVFDLKTTILPLN